MKCKKNPWVDMNTQATALVVVPIGFYPLNP
jgi:hypothetical protein